MIPLLIAIMVRSLLLGVAVALILCVLRIHSPHLQKGVWTAALVFALAMPVLMRTHGLVIHAPEYVLTLTATAASPAATSPRWPGFATIYGAVMLLMLARYALGIVRLLRICRRAPRVAAAWAANLDVRVTAELTAPATFGATILLPADHAGWSADKRAAVMAHERAHVLSRDCQRLWLAKLYKCLFWLNPLAWWLDHRIAVLAEATSDAAALEIIGDAPAYAEILLEFAAGGQTATVVAGMGNARIGARIERIVAGNAAADEPAVWHRFVAAAGVLPAMLLCATLQLAPSHWTFARGRAPMGELTSAAGMTAHVPYILSPPTMQQLIRFYPAAARHAGRDGLVTLAVTLNDAGQVTDTAILDEAPRELGFGAAAAAVAQVMKYSNPTGRSAQIDFRIKFALHRTH